MVEEGLFVMDTKDQRAVETMQQLDHLDGILHNLVNNHPFTISGGAMIIGITILKIIKKLRGK
jgi:hypothetical protein